MAKPIINHAEKQISVIDGFSGTAVSLAVFVAAVVDARRLTIPNVLTIPMVIFGVTYHTIADGTFGISMALAGMATGMAMLLPLYAVGGMGAGDVKLFTGIGVWLGPLPTLESLAVACGCAAVSSLIVRARRMRACVTTDQTSCPAEVSQTRQSLPFGPMAAVGTVFAILVN